MNIIIPMAGMGKRMRPHTLTTPKPLLPIAGKSIVQRLVEDIAKVCNDEIEEVAFVTGQFGKETEESLRQVAANVGAKASIYYQEEALGTAHAILCAKEALKGNVVIAFADTLFKADFIMNNVNDGTIWVKKVDDPRAFGVVKINKENVITDFVEKPETFVSDLAIIGIYYIKDGERLKTELQYLIDNNIKDKGEFQLTNALENMKRKGAKFSPGAVSEWLDCGNKDSTVYTNQRVLEFDKNKKLLSTTHVIQNSVIIEPCYIGENVKLINSVVGPHVSIGHNTVIEDSIIKNSIIQTHTKVFCASLSNSMIGNYVDLKGSHSDMSMGDYSTRT